MSTVKEIRELTGLSQYKIADWLGVSRGLIFLVENGKRSLPHKAHIKLAAMSMLVQQMKQTKQRRVMEAEFAEPGKLAAIHQTKMEFHQRSADGLKLQLHKLQKRHPQANSRLELLGAMKNNSTEWYSPTEIDKTWIGLIEELTNYTLDKSSIEQQDLLKDKIETHLAYAELHKQRCEKFSTML